MLTFGRVLLGMGILLLCGSAGAAEELVFVAPEGCPTSQVLTKKVRARLLGELYDLPAAEVRIRRSESAFAAEIVVADDKPRVLTAPTCDEIVDALSLIIAVRAREQRAAQERASEEQADARQSSQAAIEGATAASDASAVESKTGERLIVQGTAADNSQPRDEQTFPGPKERDSSLALRAGAGAVAMFGIANAAAWGPALVAGIRSQRGLSWTLRLSVERASTGTVDASPTGVWSRLTEARASGCALSAEFGRITLRPCAQIAGGLFEAGGTGGPVVAESHETQREWIALGPAVRAELALVGGLDAALEIAAPIPLIRERLVFVNPDTVIQETWPVTLATSLTIEFGSGTRSKRLYAGIAR